jgi:hypothetical protein
MSDFIGGIIVVAIATILLLHPLLEVIRATLP